MPDVAYLDKSALRQIVGVTGPNFVGDTDTQTLQNKTLGDLTKFKTVTATAGTQVDIYPTKTTVADTTARSVLRLHNVDDSTNDEYLEFGAYGTNQYLIDTKKAGTGTARDFSFSAGGNNSFAIGGANAATYFSSGAAYISFPANKVYFREASQTWQYIWVMSSITGNRNITLPLLTANDIFVFQDFPQTLTNKTVNAANNTLPGIVQDPVTAKRAGSLGIAGNAMRLEGMLAAHTSPQTATAAFDTTEGLTTVFASAATSGINVGLISPTVGVGVGRRLFGMRAKIRWKIDSTTTSRLWFGFTSATALAISDTPLATTDSGIVVGFSAAGTNYVILHNDGATSVTSDNVTGPIAKDANFHTVEISWLAAGNITVTFDGIAQTISADLPATTANLFFNAVGQTSAATARTVTMHGIWVEADK